MVNGRKKTKEDFSPKQKKIFLWWRTPLLSSYDGIICDGAVRSGKSMCMSMSFMVWSMSTFSGQSFGICGKTINSVRRNILTTLFSLMKNESYVINEKQSKNYFDVTLGDVTNRYYIFGGRDEGSASLIQGVTLAGVLFDETALMPRSFVEQAVARCSVTGSKLWFNCNPEHSSHWFKREWIDKAEEKQLYHLHFVIDDNPSLSKAVKERYERLYSGAFYDRFILGKWCDAAGLIYPMFSEDRHVVKTLPKSFEKFIASCDYGTVNPTSIGLWGLSGKVWYRIDEYYYDSKREGAVRTDEEHYAALERLCSGRKIEKVICDPSAASFIACIRHHGKFPAAAGKNDVISGIRKTADMLNSDRIRISDRCTDCIREFSLYRWDDSAAADRPRKENDHAMDDIRYFAASVSDEADSGFMLLSVSRSY